jgi:DNA-binding response OmpR family regulator
MSDPAVIINVDDNEPSRYVRSRILVRAGFRVHDAATGAEAVRLIAEQKPHLVLLDVHLPDVHGIELCRRIKSAPENASVIVLQISASATTAPHAVSALESGADGYLTEPVDPDVLVATVRSLLRLRKAERELLAANQRLQVLNDELRRSNEDLQQFAFAASHDLQEPLRNITSFASLLERAARQKLSAAELQYLTFISDGARRMRALIDDLLVYSQAGSEPASRQIVDLNVVLSWALENLREGIKSSGAVIHSCTLPCVSGDEPQLGHVFQNLIGNAIKYARPGIQPEIDIATSRNAELRRMSGI